MCKILSIIIICDIQDCLNISDNQFDFKISNTVSLDHYVYNYQLLICFLDASKAFVSINYW